MNLTTIRICYRKANGEVTDADWDFDLEQCGGILPNIGDEIIDPGVAPELDRSVPANRTIWKVVRRVFNAKDQGDFMALIVEERQLSNNSEGYVLI